MRRSHERPISSTSETVRVALYEGEAPQNDSSGYQQNPDGGYLPDSADTENKEYFDMDEDLSIVISQPHWHYIQGLLQSQEMHEQQRTTQMPVGHDVESFFDGFNDEFTETYPVLPKKQTSFLNLHESCLTLVEHAKIAQMTISEKGDLWDLQAHLEAQLPSEFRYISNCFRTSTQFSFHVNRVFIWEMRQEEWKKAIITSHKDPELLQIDQTMRPTLLNLL